MNREDIIRMARDAGISVFDAIKTVVSDQDGLERFAALVAAAERSAMVAEAAKQGWAMKNEDPFEDAVREIAAILAMGQA